MSIHICFVLDFIIKLCAFVFDTFFFYLSGCCSLIYFATNILTIIFTCVASGGRALFFVRMLQVSGARGPAVVAADGLVQM